MKRRRLLATWERVKDQLRAALGRRLVWITDARRDAFGQASVAPALVAVLGREHYMERRKTYPVRGWRDLTRVLDLELAVAPPTLALIGPLAQDRREVTLYELAPTALEQVGRSVFLVPESLLVAGSLPEHRVATVDRDGLRYFVAASGVSQVAGGAVVTARLFAIAAGIDEENPTLELDGAQVNSRLTQGLRKLGPQAWLRLVSPSLKLDLGLAWRPLGALTGAGLLAYLLFASTYLSLAESLRRGELEDLGPEVNSLIETHREVERLGTEKARLTEVLQQRQMTYPLWRIVAGAWAKGASINGLTLTDGRLTLRGNAPSATAVLETLAADQAVKEARFGAPVMQNRDREQFVITLNLDGGSGHD
jgi:hypothetical protein